MKILILTTVLSIGSPVAGFAVDLSTGVYSYVEGPTDIQIPNLSRRPASIEKAKVEEPREVVEADPLKDWKPEDSEKFDAYLVKEGETHEQAKHREMRSKAIKQSNQIVSQFSDSEDEDYRAPTAVKKSHKKKSKSKKKAS